MERQAHYAFVGMVTLLLAVATFGFAYWLIQGSFNESYVEYDVLFNTPVNGLTEGGEVHFNGIKVGEVRELRLGKANTTQVIATIKIDAATPVRVDSTAVLEPLGVTGLNYVQITPGSHDAAILRDEYKGPGNPIIHATGSTLDKLLAGSGGVLENAYETLNRINRLLSDDNLRTLSRSINNLESITRNVSDLTADIRSRTHVIDEAEKSIVSIGVAADNMSKLAASTDVVVRQRLPQTLDKIDVATAEIAKAGSEIGGVAKDLREPIRELSDTTLPQLNDTLQNLDDASRSVQQVVEEVRSSPQGLIGKPKARERKVKP
ncbi:MlaD family protein [Asticcacaulis tiandongensis]|uniref:MlaD family protein n=1 Tax=Asticcacaulis tiandongensis TaxID=2565365 RepID=UPI00112E2C39|nr:MlaD family protein [Asticcacaulis tiandongensis]